MGGGVSTSNVAARGDVKGVVGPDLSKAQGENGFLLLRFYQNFFNFFQKIMAYVEYPVTKTDIVLGLERQPNLQSFFLPQSCAVTIQH